MSQQIFFIIIDKDGRPQQVSESNSFSDIDSPFHLNILGAFNNIKTMIDSTSSCKFELAEFDAKLFMLSAGNSSSSGA